MKFPKLLIALTGAVLMTGCSSLISLNPAVTDQDAATDPALPGTWSSEDGKDMFLIRQSGSAYTIVYWENASTPSRLEARLFRAGDVEILNVGGSGDDPLQIPAQMFVRIWVEGASLRFAFLDSDWLKQQAIQQLASQPAGSRTLLTAPGNAVRSFLMKSGADDRAYREAATLRRVQ